MKPYVSIALFAILILSIMGGINVSSADIKGKNPVAEVMIGSSGITFVPRINYSQLELRVSRPDGSVLFKTYESAVTPYIDLATIYGNSFGEGVYTYELSAAQNAVSKTRVALDTAGLEKPEKVNQQPLIQTGHFRVRDGALVMPNAATEDLSKSMDVLHYDDVIVTGSLCVGFDCADGESFGFDTIILKEHNLRIYFNDTSYTASYPTNSWRITINDSTNGGASYFAVDDVDDGHTPFKIEAGAPSNSLYVEDYGRVGLGTSTPVVELHIKDSDTPTMRLEQDSSGGWTAQTWDVAGNESNFFVRDATNGSKLPFRIQPSTPSSTLCLKSDGFVGVGTWSPGHKLEVETTNENAEIFAQRTDGATCFLSATPYHGFFGTETNHPLRINANNAWKIQVNTDGTLDMSDGGSYDGTWNDASSREYKEDIRDITTEEAMEAFSGLNPVKFKYKAHNEEEHLGFIAEDVPEIVAMKDRKNLSSMDIVAVLTKVVQQQQKTLQKQQQVISELKKEINELKNE